MRPLTILTFLSFLLPACGDSSPDDNDNAQCEEGFRAEGPACVPIFDECPGPAEIPVLGGGCQPVGVTECASGFESDGEGGCEPILPSEPCPPGTMEMIGHTECQPVGVIDCGDGFVSDGEGGCDAILPTEPCPWGYMEILGEPECQPIGDCGTGTWGVIEIDATTVFVDATADATGADGSQGAPFVTIQEAYDVVVAGGQIAVAAGEYAERLVLDQPTRLVGRCAELVTITDASLPAADHPLVAIGAGGSGTTLRGMTLTGDATGLFITGAQGVLVENTQVFYAGRIGIVVGSESDIHLHRIVAALNSGVGLLSVGSTIITDSVVRDSIPQPELEIDGVGIASFCSLITGLCGNLTVSRTLVSGNRRYGIISMGTDVVITQTVVRDTQASVFNPESDAGIVSLCDSEAAFSCGTFSVSSSLIADNRGGGIVVGGVQATVDRSVVRDSLPHLIDEQNGGGVVASCDSDLSLCGFLNVDRSLVMGNRLVGIVATGVETTIDRTIVQNTMPQESDNFGGHGIYTGCHPYTGDCGRLNVQRSLVLANNFTGISSDGVEVIVAQTGVKETLAKVNQPDTSIGGWGVYVQPQPNGELGSLNATQCLVEGSTEAGIVIAGSDAIINATVVRNTLARQTDELGGRGIEVACDPISGCRTVQVMGAVLSENHDIGMYVEGADVEIASTAVKNTMPRQSDEESGRGINVQCDSQGSGCGSLSIDESLVIGNREVGIYVGSVDTTLTSLIVTDTQGRLSDGLLGRGINGECNIVVGDCGNLSISGCLVSGNRQLGIASIGSDLNVTTSAIRDTLPDSDGMFGRGIGVQCDADLGECGNLNVTRCLVQSSQNEGISILGVPTALEGVAVIDSQQNTEGLWAGDFGQGVHAACYPNTDWCATLEMTACLVESSYTAGVAVQAVSGSIQGSAVLQVTPRALDGAFGYGIQVEGVPGASPTVFHVSDCLIQDASLAGILYYLAGGTVSGSQISGGQYTVVMNQGANPVIQDDNELSGSIESEPEWSNMDPSPAPEPVLPIGTE
ncbi:right-handed parallel beta-helix repeat-containing protein [Myxococcota bacterium]